MLMTRWFTKAAGLECIGIDITAITVINPTVSMISRFLHLKSGIVSRKPPQLKETRSTCSTTAACKKLPWRHGWATETGAGTLPCASLFVLREEDPAFWLQSLKLQGKEQTRSMRCLFLFAMRTGHKLAPTSRTLNSRPTNEYLMSMFGIFHPSLRIQLSSFDMIFAH